MQAGNPDLAHRHFAEAHTWALELGYKKDEVIALLGLARIESDGERLAQARRLADEIDLPAGRLLGAALAGDIESANAILDGAARSIPGRQRMKCLFLMWQKSGDRAHLAAAHEILRMLVDNAPAEYRANMIERVPLHRDIDAAWRS